MTGLAVACHTAVADAPATEPNGVHERAFTEAEAAWRAQPEVETRIVWYGRQLAYRGEYAAAIRVFTGGLALHPGSYRLLRHRGHRFLTLRRFADAERDLARAAWLAASHPDAVEADGRPNAAGIPRSTTHGNIGYHLALSRYLQGRFADAAADMEWALGFAANDDSLCAASYWRYLALRRAGDDAAAVRTLKPIRSGMELLENFAYHRLLLLFRGEADAEELLAAAEADGVEFATTAYGVARWWAVQGRSAESRALLERIVAETPAAAFGHLAAEIDLAAAAVLDGARVDPLRPRPASTAAR
ncbi:MAG TPA: hypothetical protein VGC54_10310 [Planctomycetota bacterium]